MFTKSGPFSALCLRRNASKATRENYGGVIKIHSFFISQHSGLPKFCQFGKRQAPKNPEESSNEILKILGMRPISIKKHEWIFANILPISITKHEMAFWNS